MQIKEFIKTSNALQMNIKKNEESQKPQKKIYYVNSGSLFPYYISNPESLSKSDLNLLEQYQTFPNLNPELYCNNCFIQTLKQYGVPNDKIDVIRTTLVDDFVKIKDISHLGKTTKL